jgi:endonuclease YncB( thermonuclease family)
MRWLCISVFLFAAHAVAEPITPAEITIVDGDTIKAHGDTYRLVDFDTPEIRHPRRPVPAHERELGLKASARLNELINGANLDLREIRCSCPESAIGTKWCNAGRKCGLLTVHGENVGAVLIREGLAREFLCGATRCPKQKPWP